MPAILITCPHATCAIPEAYRELFSEHQDLVTSVEGWEPGALNLAQALSMKFSTQLIYGDVSRLLIDLEQAGEKRWSMISSQLSELAREKIVARIEMKFRNEHDTRVKECLLRNDSAVHLIIRTAPTSDRHIAFEYAGSEAAKALAFSASKQLPPGLEVSCIALDPKSSLEEWLLDRFSDQNYGVIRLNVAQSFFLQSVPMRWDTVKKSIVQALSAEVKS
jgi:hypothetical protein